MGFLSSIPLAYFTMSECSHFRSLPGISSMASIAVWPVLNASVFQDFLLCPLLTYALNSMANCLLSLQAPFRQRAS